MEWYLKVLSNYATFTGRARRKEYWMFVLVNFLIILGLQVAAKLTHLRLIAIVHLAYSLGVIIPHIAVAARRMHDTNRSGWFMIIPFYSLYLLCLEGDAEANNFGPNPKDSAPGPRGSQAAA